ncbi:MAG: hypothetical protein C1943_03305 [Halochromatium sp.]|nr:hypothetical protein [Halochromatium sp.]
MRPLMSEFSRKLFTPARHLLNSLGYYKPSRANVTDLVCQQLRYRYPQCASRFGSLGTGRLALTDLITYNAVGIELGVAEGYFSDVMLSSERIGRLFSVDCWSDHHDSAEYVRAVARLAKYGNRSLVMRSSFDDALSFFSNGYFDFIYIDAYAHTGQEDGGILNKWYPKLKSGGLFSGHDYDVNEWPKTVEAVGRFAKRFGKEVMTLPGVLTENPEDKYPSWYFFS